MKSTHIYITQLIVTLIISVALPLLLAATKPEISSILSSQQLALMF